MCPNCGNALETGGLFFPDNDKDYTKDELVYRDWQVVEERIRQAFHLTIFGYSGPRTDYKARELLLQGWRQTPMREFSHVEIIDIRGEDELRDCWSEFIPFDHAMVTHDFWCSTVAKWPRRTAEYKQAASLQGIPSEVFGPFHTDSLSDLQTWFARIAKAENAEKDEHDTQQGD